MAEERPSCYDEQTASWETGQTFAYSQINETESFYALKKVIPLIRPSMPMIEEYYNEISSIWDSRILTNMAKKHQELERMLKAYLDVPNFQLFVNGHQALETALQAFDLTGEVITTPFTFVSTIHAIVRCGLTPVFCDVREDNFTIDESKIERLITEKTSAILPVHVYGAVCAVEEIQRIANKYNLKVIYDAAHAFGVTYAGRGIGSFGDMSMYSFHATKVYHSIEGGGLAFRDSGLDGTLKAIKDFGITGNETVDFVGGNAKLDEFRAAMGLCNLRHVGEEIVKRGIASARYDERLCEQKEIRLLPDQKGVRKNHAYYPIMLDGYRKTRDELYAELRARNVITRKYFYPLCCDLGCYRKCFGGADVPVARRVSDGILCLPMYAGLTIQEVDRVCDAILG